MAAITGTTGDDVLSGTEFDDVIRALAGADIINTGSGDDQAYGGSGDDFLNGDGNDALYGGDGNDRIQANDIFSQSTALVRGGAGDDQVVVFDTSSGGDLRGGDGIDLLTLYIGSAALHLDLGLDLVDAGPTAFVGLMFSGFEQLFVSAGDGDDSIIGADQADVIRVAGGANYVDLAGGDDLVEYQTRDANTVYGGDGADTLMANSGTSSLYFIVDTFDGSVDDGSLSTIAGFERYNVTGAEQNDIASLGTLRDVFYGGEGADTGIGGGGGDLLFGGAQNDSLRGDIGRDRLYGGNGADMLYGGFGDDVIHGGPGLDTIFGGVGNDRINLYIGNDQVSGGTGADSFEFTRNQWGLHEITDFETGVDKLTYAGMFLPGGAPPAGPLDPALLAYGSATGPAAQFVVTYSVSDDLTTLLWDPNGDIPSGGTYAVVTLTGAVNLTAANIFIV